MKRDLVESRVYLILVAVARLKDPSSGSSFASGVSIRKEIEEKANRKMAIGTVCAILDRLEKGGFLESEVSDRDGRRPKRFYKLTETGYTAIAEVRAAFSSMEEGIDGLLPTLIPIR